MKVRSSGTSGPEGVAADAQGNVYGAEVGQKGLKKYVRKIRESEKVGRVGS